MSDLPPASHQTPLSLSSDPSFPTPVPAIPPTAEIPPPLLNSSPPRPQQKAHPPPQHHHHANYNPRQLEYRHFIPLLRHAAQSARGTFDRGCHGGEDFGLFLLR